MNKKYLQIIFIVLLVIEIILFTQLYVELYRSSSKEFQPLYFAIAMAGFGIFSHFFKKRSKYKDKKGQKLAWDTIELLMLVATPVVVSFDILKEYHNDNPIPIILLSAIAFGLWYAVSIFRAGKLDPNDSKQVFFTTTIIYGLFVGFLAFAVLIIIR